jgi:steroid delta-isomerase-like uncharacterized protein
LRDIVDRYIASYNAFDIAGMLSLLAPDVRFENYEGDDLTVSTSGIDEFGELAERSKAAFSEREQRVTSMRIEHGRVIVDIDYRGRLAVDMPGGPPAGTLIELRGQSEFSFSDGKIDIIIDRS